MAVSVQMSAKAKYPRRRVRAHRSRRNPERSTPEKRAPLTSMMCSSRADPATRPSGNTAHGLCLEDQTVLLGGRACGRTWRTIKLSRSHNGLRPTNALTSAAVLSACQLAPPHERVCPGLAARVRADTTGRRVDDPLAPIQSRSGEPVDRRRPRIDLLLRCHAEVSVPHVDDDEEPHTRCSFTDERLGECLRSGSRGRDRPWPKSCARGRR